MTNNKSTSGDYFGYVKKTQDDMKKVGDLANFNRDRMSTWEKQKADKEYADSSRLAEAKLQQEKSNDDGSFFGASKETMNKLKTANETQRIKYLKTGEI